MQRDVNRAVGALLAAQGQIVTGTLVQPAIERHFELQLLVALGIDLPWLLNDLTAPD